MEQWDSIGITENGASAARRLGRSLAGVAGFPRVNVVSWGQSRCAETATAVAEGLTEGGASVSAAATLNLNGPISDHSAYKEMITSNRWQEVLELWQRAASTKGSLTPIAEYASSSFTEILASTTSPPNQLTLIVTHDLHILPLARHAAGTKVPLPDYLDGFVISEREGEFLFGYGEFMKSIDLDSLTH
jgi:broad specificity phosphatase PhoE